MMAGIVVERGVDAEGRAWIGASISVVGLYLGDYGGARAVSIECSGVIYFGVGS